MDSAQPPRTVYPHHSHQRRHCEQRYPSPASAERHALYCKTIPRATTADRGRENLRKTIRETMTADLKIRLLVVDDEQSIRRLCMTIGTTLGFACTEAESAESAVARLDAESPDLV